jgi:hypothetical protein
LGGGGCAAVFALLEDSDPDDLKSEGVPSSRGASFGGTMSTTIASGGIASDGADSNEFAPTRSSPSTRTPTWPMTETTNPKRTKRFNPII